MPGAAWGHDTLRKLGLIGGMSWVSTRSYYERINRYIQRHTDKRASAPMLIDSLDFADVYQRQQAGDWAGITQIIGDSARRLEAAGAGMIIIGANAMHKVFPEVEAQVEVPMLHIAECVGAKMEQDGITRAALIGLRSVMTESFYRRRLVAHGVDLLPPDMGDVDTLSRIINDELMMGKASRDAERSMKSMFTNFQKVGAQAVVMANTELGQVVDVGANILRIYDCTAIHADAAAAWIIGD